ncbi:MAG: cytochrome c, partial [Myxococcales bacterium]|nr:cytochrome c [Myxococcales bacterium]
PVACDGVCGAVTRDLGAVTREPEVAMADLSGSLWRSDHPGVAREAQRIADHPHIAPSEIARIHAVLGDRMTAFHRADEDVHDSAVRLAEAAGSNDVPAILQHLAELQAGCVACHRGFREDLRQP